ncbi:MAG TPA: hypothetical protein VFE34_24730 [Dongiaceae bacterium]|jgi:hypothetical protein|nr:hypothetical protein [Dongiaceae bacterium]
MPPRPRPTQASESTSLEQAPAESFGDTRLHDHILLVGYASADEASIDRGIVELAHAVNAVG